VKSRTDGIVNVKNPVTSVQEFVQWIPFAEKRFGTSSRVEEMPLLAVFRGHEDVGFKLWSSLHRACHPVAGQVKTEQCYRYEMSILNEVEKHYPDEMRRCKTYVEKLTWMQHFGFPTRLLDVTMNALVALYFATGGSEKTDGEVLVIGTMRWERDQTLKNLNKSLRLLTPEYYRKNHSILEHGGIRNNRKSYGPRLIMPPFLSERQKRQSGAFYLMSNVLDEKDARVARLPRGNDSVEDSGQLVQGIVIDGHQKTAIRRELAERYGISRHFLFPESPSDFADEVKQFAEAQMTLAPLAAPFA